MFDDPPSSKQLKGGKKKSKASSKKTPPEPALEFESPEEALRFAEYNLPSQAGWRKTYTHHTHAHSFTVTAIDDYSRPPKGKFHFKQGQSIMVSAAWNFPYKKRKKKSGAAPITNVGTQSVRFQDGRIDVAFPVHPHDPKVRWIGQVLVPYDRNNPVVGPIGDFPCTKVELPNEKNIAEHLLISLGGPKPLKLKSSLKKKQP